jgi:hypothetical protein
MIATIVVLFCVVNFFSLKPGASLRFAFLSITYFFLVMGLLIASAILLKNISVSFYIPGGTSGLLGAALVHFCYGLLILLLYVKNVISR